MTSTNEVMNHDSLIESLEQAKKDQKIDKHTLDQAREVLKDTNLSPEQSERIQELINHLDNLNTSTQTGVRETLDAVEMNPDEAIKSLDKINTSKDLSKVTNKFTTNLQKQLEFCKTKHPEKYAKLVFGLVQLSLIYEVKLANKETQNIAHLDTLINNQGKEFELALTEKSLDLKNNTLEANLQLFAGEQDETTKNVILDYIYETEIKNKGYNIKHDINNTFVVLNNAGVEVKSDNVLKLQKYISSLDLKQYNTFQESEEYKAVNQMELINGKTVSQILIQSPSETQRDIRNLTETTGFKMLIPAAIIAFLFGVGTDMSFMKRLGVLVGGGLAFGALNASAKEMGHDGILNAIGLGKITDGIDKLGREYLSKSNDWKQDSSSNRLFNKINQLNDANTEKLDNGDLYNLFDEANGNETFQNIHISQIVSYINADGSIIAKDLFGEDLPTDGNGNEFSGAKLKLFLQLLLSAKDNSDQKGSDLLSTSYDIALGTSTNQSTSTTPQALGTNANQSTSTAPQALGTNANQSTSTAPQALGTEGEKKKIETLRYSTVGYFEEGRSHLFADDSSDTPLTYETLSESFKNQLIEHEQLTIKADNLLFILSAMGDKNEKITTLHESINNVQLLNLEQTTPQLKNTLQTIIDSLPSGLEDISNMNHVLEYLKDEGYYDAVKGYIVEENFNELIKINEEELWAYIDNGTTTPLIEKLLSEDSDLRQKIIEKKAEVDLYIEENREAILSQYPQIDENEVISMTRKMFLEGYAKELLFYTYLDYHTKWSASSVKIGQGDVQEQAAIFGDIEGIGLFDVSEKNFDFWSKEALIFLLTQTAAIAAGMVTFGAGTVAINALVYGTRSVRVLKHMHTVGRFANNGNKLARLARGTSVSALGGASFNVGYTGAQSIVEGENLYTAEGFKDAAIFGVALKGLGAINKLIGTGAQKIKLDKVGNIIGNTGFGIGRLAKTGGYIIKEGFNIGAPLLIAMGLDTGEGAIDNGEWLGDISFEPGEWTQEEILEALTLIVSYRLMRNNSTLQSINSGAQQTGKHIGQKLNIRMKKGKNGRVEIQQSSNTNSSANLSPREQSLKQFDELKSGESFTAYNGVKVTKK